MISGVSSSAANTFMTVATMHAQPFLMESPYMSAILNIVSTDERAFIDAPYASDGLVDGDWSGR